MPHSTFKSSFSITHIGTATAIFEIDDVKFLTDPFFSPAGTTWDVGNGMVLKNTDTPALGLENLPPIDAILLSHEDHVDNLDEYGRQLLNGRHVFTTVDGGKNLQPRPAVRGMKPWETVSVLLGGKKFDITATPCQHLPPDPEKFHVVAAVMNLGNAHAPTPDGMLQVTMDGKQAAHLLHVIKADCLVPMHYESWGHFTQFEEELIRVFEEEGISDKVRWLTPGKSVRII